jgi:hypothetical protein
MTAARGFFGETSEMLGDSARELRGRLTNEAASIEWRFGSKSRARELANDAEKLLPVSARPFRLAYLFAELGDETRMRSLLEQLEAEFPASTGLTLWNAMSEATLLVSRNKPEAALQLLAPIKRFQGRWRDVALVRAQALHQANKLPEAAAEFQWVVNQMPTFPGMTAAPIAMVSLARVRAAMGDVAGAKQAYDQFLDYWKDADSDLPLLAEARKERAALK